MPDAPKSALQTAIDTQTNNAAMASWLIGTLLAFTVSADAGWMFVIGVAAQWALHAPKAVPTIVAQIGVIVACIGIYYGMHRPVLPIPYTWWQAACFWALSALGVSSLSSSTKGAPRTDSL